MVNSSHLVATSDESEHQRKGCQPQQKQNRCPESQVHRALLSKEVEEVCNVCAGRRSCSNPLWFLAFGEIVCSAAGVDRAFCLPGVAECTTGRGAAKMGRSPCNLLPP